MSNPERVRPLEPDEWSPQVRELFAGIRDAVGEMEGGEGESGTLNILRTIAHHPGILGPFLGFAGSRTTCTSIPAFW